MDTTRERIRTETGRAPTLITIGDTAYPANLREIQAPPERLYVRGALVEDDALAIAVVGSRAATPYGLAVAERLGADLAARGVTPPTAGPSGRGAAPSPCSALEWT
jgi:DNA processing protein